VFRTLKSAWDWHETALTHALVSAAAIIRTGTPIDTIVAIVDLYNQSSRARSAAIAFSFAPLGPAAC
jgi:hypothetical protein